jgi:O-antigen/teichoic acid export membrane protein
LHQNDNNKEKLLGSALIIKLINGFFIVSIATISSFIFANTPSTVLMIFIYSSFSIFLSFNVIDFYLKINSKNKSLSIISAIVVVLSAMVKIFIMYLNIPLIYLLSSYVLDYILATIGYIYLYSRYIGNIFKLKLDKQIIKYLIIKSWPFSLAALATSIYMKVDQIFIKVLLGSESVGLYAIAVRFSEIWFIFAEIICLSLLPAILNSEKIDNNLFLNRSKKIYSLLFYSSLLICIIIYIISPFLINTLYGEAYKESASILRLYSWSIIGFFMTIALHQFIFAKNKFKTMLLMTIIGMVFSLILNYILIPIYGIYGAAVANILAYTLPFLIILAFKDMKNQRVAFINGVTHPFS